MGLKMGDWEFYRRGGGTPSDIHHRIQCARFIPADAGNTSVRREISPSLPVYPCWRGELSVQALQTWLPGGLSPLTRGTRSPSFHLCLNSRFIPAGAGNSRGIMFTVMRPPVYPRWRGELIVHINNRGEFNGLSPLARGTHYGPAKNALVGGLSPLARGTLGGLPCSQLQQRFIPAGAGNSSWLAISFGVSPVYPRWRGEL